MKAIRTKYHGPGNVRGSRISATDDDGNRVTIPYPHQLNSEDGHLLAARTLCRKMNWTGKLVRGSLRDCYVFVWLDERDTFDAGMVPLRTYAG